MVFIWNSECLFLCVFFCFNRTYIYLKVFVCIPLTIVTLSSTFIQNTNICIYAMYVKSSYSSTRRMHKFSSGLFFIVMHYSQKTTIDKQTRETEIKKTGVLISRNRAGTIARAKEKNYKILGKKQNIVRLLIIFFISNRVASEALTCFPQGYDYCLIKSSYRIFTFIASLNEMWLFALCQHSG